MTGRTAAEEHFGVGIEVDIAADYRLRLPFGPGGVRLYVLRPDAPGIAAILPDATLLQVGGAPQFVVCNDGTDTMTVEDSDGDTVATIAVGSSEELILADNASPAGGWLSRSFSFTLGTQLDYDRVPVEIVLTETIRDGFNARDYARELGYEDNVAYAVRVTIREGVVIGNDAATPAFNTGEWPAGTTMLLVLEQDARICGKGGNGGRGGDVPPGLLAQNGTAGGVALRTYLDLAIANHGYIQGGGGGGGGGAQSAGVPGGGGGGGAGYVESTGAAPGNLGTGQAPSYGHGQPGTIGLAGAGGGTAAGNGGNGGAPGTAGSNGNATGGAAGDAIQRLTGTTVTKIVTGTINGAEVTF